MATLSDLEGWIDEIRDYAGYIKTAIDQSDVELDDHDDCHEECPDADEFETMATFVRDISDYELDELDDIITKAREIKRDLCL